MRICLLSNEFPAAPPNDGPSAYISQLAQGLSELGHEVTVICSRSASVSASEKIRVVVASPPQRLGDLRISRRVMPASLQEAVTLLGFWHAFSEIGGSKSFDVVETYESLSGALLSAFCRETPTVLRIAKGHHLPTDVFDKQFSTLTAGFARACIDVFSSESVNTDAPTGVVMVNSCKDRNELASRALTIYAAAIARFASEKKPHLYRHGAERLIKSTEDMIVLHENMLYDLLFKVSYKFRILHWLRKLSADPRAFSARVIRLLSHKA